MRPLRFASPLLFVVGLGLLALAFVENQATLSLFLIFPVITATGVWAVLGILLMVAGFFAFFLSWPLGTLPARPPVTGSPGAPPAPGAPSYPPQDELQRRRWGGVVFIGPIPVVFGSDASVTKWMLVLGLVLFVALVILTVLALRGV